MSRPSQSTRPGIVIAASGISDRPATAGIVEHLAQAGRAAMTAAQAETIDVLINTGVYRDNNTVEPAVAALVQQALGVGLDYGPADPRCFAFDLMHGACGVLQAVQAAQGLLSASPAERVLIVAGDTHPSTRRTAPLPDFRYETAGAALLLGRGEPSVGFGRVHTGLRSGRAGIEGYVDTTTMGTRGRRLMTVNRAAMIEGMLLDLAQATATEALDEAGVDPAETVLIASTPSPRFPVELSLRLGLRLPDLHDPAGDTHTAALPRAYHRLTAAGQLDGVRDVLFVAAGAGPAAGAVVYRRPESVAGAGR